MDDVLDDCPLRPCYGTCIFIDEPWMMPGILFHGEKHSHKLCVENSMIMDEYLRTAVCSRTG